MKEKYENIYKELLLEFNDQVGKNISIDDKKIKRLFLEICILFKDKISIKSKEERKNNLIYLINKKLDLNKSIIKNLIDKIAKEKIYFNFHEKDQIAEAFNERKEEKIYDVLLRKLKNNEIEKYFKNNDFLTDDIVLLKALKEKEQHKFWESVFSGYIFRAFSNELEIKKYFSKETGEIVDYYDLLKNKYGDIFDRDMSLVYLNISKEKYTFLNNYNIFRDNILERIKEYYNKLNNHCYLAIKIEDMVEEETSEDIKWKLFSDIVIFAEKFKEIKLETGYFKHERIADETIEYIKELEKEKSKFEISNEGYTYKDCFILKNDQKKNYDILIVFQKNERDEREVPCPACWSTNVRANSYPNINIKSWECSNPLCPDRTKTNRGKRYSLESLIKQKAINEDENLIPIESIRKWKLDVIGIKNDEEIVEMLVRHYSLVNDTVYLIDLPKIKENFIKRKVINIDFNIDKNIENIFEKFEESSFFKRFLYTKKNKEKYKYDNLSKLEKITVYNGDSYDVLNSLENETIDGAVTSPPYYNAKDYSYWKNIYCYLYDMYNITQQTYRVLKKEGYFIYNIFDYFDNENTIAFSDMGKKRMILGAYIIYLFNKCGFKIQKNIVWFKGEIQGNRSFNQGNNSPYYQAPLNAWEHIFVFKKGVIDINDKFPDILELQPVKKYIKGVNTLGHDAPYPEEIPLLLINKLNKNKDLILDTFSGSMTTGRTAYKNNISSINIDYKIDYCRLGLKLLKNEIKNNLTNENELKLF